MHTEKANQTANKIAARDWPGLCNGAVWLHIKNHHRCGQRRNNPVTAAIYRVQEYRTQAHAQKCPQCCTPALGGKKGMDTVQCLHKYSLIRTMVLLRG